MKGCPSFTRSGIGRLGWAVAGVSLTLTVMPLTATPASAALAVHCPADNLQAAINAAPPGSTVNVSGTCIGNFRIKKDLTLRGPATLDGGGSGSVIEWPGPDFNRRVNITLISLTVQHGQKGIYGLSGRLDVRESTVRGNSGVGIRSSGGEVGVVSSTITDNGAGIGGDGSLSLRSSVISRNRDAGLFWQGNFTIESSVVSDNGGLGIDNAAPGFGIETITSSRIARNGVGGIFNLESDLTIRSSIVEGNDGGGIFNSGTLTLVSSVVMGNRGYDGGGIANVALGVFPHVTLISSTVEHNTARHDGGGIFNSGDLALRGSSVSGNHASDRGGGIFNDVGYSVSATAAWVSANTPNNCTPPGSVPGCRA
jgi:nitrous oxidase accessory protein NosD